MRNRGDDHLETRLNPYFRGRGIRAFLYALPERENEEVGSWDEL